jgi:Flp pilus assembly protein TadG
MHTMRRWVRDQRGSIMLFTIVLVLPLMIIIGGLAMDLAYYATVDDQLQRSMDSAALAGAGKLGFNDTFFPAARQWARDYALLNPYRVGTINLDLNTANNPNGNIVLGIWNGGTFTPSLDGTQVNAVQCRFATTAPTSFLRLIGVNSLNTGAMAIAWAAQPATTPPAACVFPMALSQCFFQGDTSLGCGATATFISSSDESVIGANSGAWASVIPNLAPNNENILAQVQAAASGACGGTALNTGDGVPVNNGQLNDIINWLKGTDPNAFPAKYAASDEIVVLKQDGTDAYRGKGWEVYVPVIDTGAGCPPNGPITGTLPITGWTRFVITQVLGKNGKCAVNNPWQRGGAGNPWDRYCFLDGGNGTAPPPPTTTVVQGATGIFGYYDCQYTPVPPAPNPGPITATAKLKLVK